VLMPKQAPPVIRNRSFHARARSVERVWPSTDDVLDSKKIKVKCQSFPVEITLLDGSTTTDTQDLLAFFIPGTTDGWQYTQYACVPPTSS